MDLNNRFALDGHSPPSMAGLLGCMGLFETPRGERSVTGSVGMRFLKPRYLALRPDARLASSRTIDRRHSEAAAEKSRSDAWQELTEVQQQKMAAALGVELGTGL
jgi:hypothetical protein